MTTKTIRRSVKSFVKAVDDEQGHIEKIVSVFNNVDYANDRVKQGAFEASLVEWKTSGDPIPVIFSHQWNNLDAHVGVVDDAKELAPGDELLPEEIKDLGGLWVREKYDMDQPFAARLYQLQKERRIKESSFAYDVVTEKKAKDGANDLIELKLIEVGPTLKGMNPATQLLAAKAMAEDIIANVKAYVTLDGSFEQLRDDLAAAVNEWVTVQFAGEDIWTAGLEASYPDHLVAYVELWEDPPGRGKFHQTSWERGEDGAIVLGEPIEVKVTGIVAPKAVLEYAAVKAAAAGQSAVPAPRYSDAKSLLTEIDLLEVDHR